MINSPQDNMMDFIVAVRDPQAWHQVNMAQNPKHYSSLRLGGPHFISRIQENWGAKIYFNTLIPTHEGVRQHFIILYYTKHSSVATFHCHICTYWVKKCLCLLFTMVF